MNTAITATLGAAVVAVSIGLGVTAPTTSPVTPPVAAAVTDPGRSGFDPRPDGQRDDGL